MNQEQTRLYKADIRVVGYEDGVFNLQVQRGGNTERIELTDEYADLLCSFLGEEMPNPEPSPPEQWK